jgi:hypothetical protein
LSGPLVPCGAALRLASTHPFSLPSHSLPSFSFPFNPLLSHGRIEGSLCIPSNSRRRAGKRSSTYPITQRDTAGLGRGPSRGTSDIFLFFLCFTVSVSTFSQHVGFPDVSHSTCDVPSCGVTDRRGIPFTGAFHSAGNQPLSSPFPFLSSVPLSLSVDPILLRFPLCRFGVFSVILLPLYRRPSPVPIHYTHCHSRHRSIASQGGCAVFEHPHPPCRVTSRYTGPPMHGHRSALVTQSPQHGFPSSPPLFPICLDELAWAIGLL